MITGAHFRLLGDVLHVLPQTPPWQQAVTAHRMLEDARRGTGNSAELEDQLLRLYESARMLRDNLGLIGEVLLHGAFLAGLKPGATLAEGMPAALHQLALGLQFATIDTRRVAIALQNLQGHLQALGATLPGPPGFSARGELTDGALASLPKAFAAGVAFTGGHDWQARSASAWRQLLERLAAARMHITTTMPGFDELLCTARQTGPAAWLPLNPQDAGLHSWSRLLMAATAGGSTCPAGTQVPFGVVAHALLRSGFGGADAAWIASCSQALAAAAGAPPADADALRLTLLDAQTTRRDKPPSGTLVLLRRPTGSVSDAWTQTPARACVLVLTPDEFRPLLQAATPAPLLLAVLPAGTRFFLEPPADTDGAADTALLADISRRWPGSLVELAPGREPALSSPAGADLLAGVPS
ncbi:MAG: hypothetical protein QE285_00300 [Aquabacterium sp.]|nr:hypothetical protein [Aquabacterium sp.]